MKLENLEGNLQRNYICMLYLIRLIVPWLRNIAIFPGYYNLITLW